MRRILVLSALLVGLTALATGCGPKQASSPPPAQRGTPAEAPPRSGAAMDTAPAPTVAPTRAERAPGAEEKAAPTRGTEARAAPTPTRAGTRSVMSARPICYRKCQEEFERCVARASANGGKGRLGCNGAQRECIASCDRLLK